MIAHLKELKIQRAVIDGETWIDIVLITLLEFLKVFRLSYSESRGFCIFGRIPELTAGNIGDHWPLETLTGGGEYFSSFAKNNNKKKRLLNQG